MSRYLIAIFFSAISISVRAQVAEKLQQLGMENIQIATDGDNTTVAFEDNMYRGTYRGIGKAIVAAIEGMYREIYKWWYWNKVSPNFASHYPGNSNRIQGETNHNR